MRDELTRRFARLHRRHVAAYSIISVAPPIFYIQLHLEMIEELSENFDLLFSRLRGHPAYCLCRFAFNLTPAHLDLVERQAARCTERFPDVRFIYLCNQPGEAERFEARGARAAFCISSAFSDEAVFAPLPSIEKRFDAVYIARLDKWKRHGLADEIASLALIYYPVPGDDPKYVAEIHRRFSRAHFFNHPANGPFKLLAAKEVNRCLNECRVGLALSSEEGAMNASVEYLLSGLPVVTTPSQGGRDLFLDEEFALTVPPDASAVRDAVAELIRRAPPAAQIRHATLERIRVHRRTFIDLVQGLYEQNGVRRSFAEEWPRVFFHRMLRNQSHLDTLAMIQQAGAAGPP